MWVRDILSASGVPNMLYKVSWVQSILCAKYPGYKVSCDIGKGGSIVAVLKWGHGNEARTIIGPKICVVCVCVLTDISSPE